MESKKSIVFVAAALASILTASGAKVVFDSATLNASSELSSVTLSQTPQDLGTSTLTYTDFTVTSSHTSLPSTIGALDYGSGTSLPGIGVNTGSVKIEEISRNELLTVDFTQQVEVGQIILQGWGNNDDPVIIALASDPGVISVTTFDNTGALDGDGLEAQPNGYSYSSGLLTLRIDGFAHSTVIDFENAVSLTSFSVFADTINSGSGGVALGGFTYETATQTPYDTWATGNEPFAGDANGDGVPDGLAFLLGAPTPATNATGLLPSAEPDGSGGLELKFTMLKPANGAPAVLGLEHSGDLGSGDPWTYVEVPAATGPAGGVSFTITENAGDPTKNDVVATISSAGNAIDGRLFGRLSGSN